MALYTLSYKKEYIKSGSTTAPRGHLCNVTFQQRFVRWISRCLILLYMTEKSEFRDLILLNLEVQDALPVHFAVDHWTSKINLALLGIIAYYFAEDRQLRQSVLALRELSLAVS